MSETVGEFVNPAGHAEKGPCFYKHVLALASIGTDHRVICSQLCYKKVIVILVSFVATRKEFGVAVRYPWYRAEKH